MKKRAFKSTVYVFTALMLILLTSCKNNPFERSGGGESALSSENKGSENRGIENKSIDSKEFKNNIVSKGDGEEEFPEMEMEIIFHVLSSRETMDIDSGKIPFAYLSVSEIKLSDNSVSAYPKLAEAIKKTFDYYVEEAYTRFAALSFSSLESNYEGYLGDYKTTFSDVLDVSISRADERIFSCLIVRNSYWGGAHPNYGYGMLSFDTQSGEPLDINDVVYADKISAEMIWDELQPFYTDKSEYEGSEELKSGIMTCIEEVVKERYYTWVLDDEGLHIYFSPYEIASHAFGGSESIFSYEDYPDIFKEKYLPTGKNFSIDWSDEEKKLSFEEILEYVEENEIREYYQECLDKYKEMF